jgi:uncharacterized membrane protein HdeD (DUF308 family)
MSTSSYRAANSVKHWYIPLVIGLLLIVLGIDVLDTPVSSFLALSLLFALLFLLSGILEIAFSIANQLKLHSWGWYLAGGIFSTLFGLLLLRRPGLSMVTLPIMIGLFLLFNSVNAIGWAFDLKKLGVHSWGNVALMGVLGLVFSFILLWNPLFAGLSLVIWTGLSLIVTGLSGIMMSLHLKKVKRFSRKR